MMDILIILYFLGMFGLCMYVQVPNGVVNTIGAAIVLTFWPIPIILGIVVRLIKLWRK